MAEQLVFISPHNAKQVLAGALSILLFVLSAVWHHFPSSRYHTTFYHSINLISLFKTTLLVDTPSLLLCCCVVRLSSLVYSYCCCPRRISGILGSSCVSQRVPLKLTSWKICGADLVKFKLRILLLNQVVILLDDL